eukprot:TRINITY_DN14133_c0_g1_i1.p2 TRINITY_DN14133_c0_g1~~TRINITY_DN14133_c0_g1_i1.p2  ORF type:complete len:109 (+),score=15.23 TRINITY_DN14133_c0_g1_i1:553-879(+)
MRVECYSIVFLLLHHCLVETLVEGCLVETLVECCLVETTVEGCLLEPWQVTVAKGRTKNMQRSRQTVGVIGIKKQSTTREARTAQAVKSLEAEDPESAKSVDVDDCPG